MGKIAPDPKPNAKTLESVKDRFEHVDQHRLPEHRPQPVRYARVYGRLIALLIALVILLSLGAAIAAVWLGLVEGYSEALREAWRSWRLSETQAAGGLSQDSLAMTQPALGPAKTQCFPQGYPLTRVCAHRGEKFAAWKLGNSRSSALCTRG